MVNPRNFDALIGNGMLLSFFEENIFAPFEFIMKAYTIDPKKTLRMIVHYGFVEKLVLILKSFLEKFIPKIKRLND